MKPNCSNFSRLASIEEPFKTIVVIAVDIVKVATIVIIKAFENGAAILGFAAEGRTAEDSCLVVRLGIG